MSDAECEALMAQIASLEGDLRLSKAERSLLERDYTRVVNERDASHRRAMALAKENEDLRRAMMGHTTLSPDRNVHTRPTVPPRSRR